MLQEAILCQRLHHGRKVPGVFGRTMPLVEGQHLVSVHSHTSDTYMSCRCLSPKSPTHPAFRDRRITRLRQRGVVTATPRSKEAARARSMFVVCTPSAVSSASGRGYQG